jgi:hypothetical protein
MAIPMWKVRKAVLERFGLEYKPGNYYSLPATFSTHPSHVRVEGVCIAGQTACVKVLSQAEAREVSKTGARRPHRILAWCRFCNHWKFAGKILQHQKFCNKKEEVR